MNKLINEIKKKQNSEKTREMHKNQINICI